MQELAAFQDRRSGFGARVISPDSVIFTTDSNFSIFSSNSASVDRCSFASDIPDQESQDSCVSDISQEWAENDGSAFASFGTWRCSCLNGEICLVRRVEFFDLKRHLAGHGLRECSASTSSGGPYSDPDPHKLTVYSKNSRTHLFTRKQKEKVQELEWSEIETEDDNSISIIDSAINSFSQALKGLECQNRRSRSNAARKRPDRRRPASLDLNNSVINAANSSSPRFAIMKKYSVLNRRAGTFPSPGTPNYRQTRDGIQKEWSSEHVHNNANRRHVSTAFMPCENGRTLPSKWEDAERWILSPISVYAPVRHSVQQLQRQPKSKSGPLGPPGIAYHSMYSPAVPMFEGRNAGNQIANSSFSAGVMVTHGLSLQREENFPVSVEPCIARSASVHGCSELISQSSLPGYPDEKHDGFEHLATNVVRTISRRDMATQMSPKSSQRSSPRHESSFSPSSPILPIVELRSIHSSKPEVRDVQVDDRIMVTKWTGKNRTRVPGRGSGNADDYKRKAVEIHSSCWDVSDTAKTTSKLPREEAKITAWENLQKAKAEAAIRKLEMKLEKKRSSSMDKIMNKLKSAQKKAQEMRSLVLSNQSRQVGRTSHKFIFRQIGSFSGCFTCHAF